ncbi:hypothetical protein ABPG74_021475 [Tetrahymena malaccensis]
MNYESAIQLINDSNFLKQENNIHQIIQLIQQAGLQQNLKKNSVSLVTKFLQVMCALKDMKKKIFLDSLLESLKAIQLSTKKGLKIDMKIIIMKIISFAGDNSFIDEGLLLSKYYYYQQKNPSCFYYEFSKTNPRWNLTDLEADIIKNTDDPKDKEKNTYVLISRIKLLQRTVGGFSSYYEETKSNLQLASLVISEKDTYFKDYIFLTHKMIINALKGNEKIDQCTICSFYFYHLNQENITIDQFGAMLVDILNLNKQNSFQKNIIHSIIVDCIQQISSKSSKNIYTQIFENKIVINMIEVLCFQLEDLQLIEKTALYLSEIPYNQKIQHISILLKISSALKEEKQAIEERILQKSQMQQQKQLFKYEQQNISNLSFNNDQQSMTIIQDKCTQQLSYGNQNTNASSLFTVTQSHINTNQKYNNDCKKKSRRSKSKKRISNTPLEIDKQIKDNDQFEEINNNNYNDNNGSNNDDELYFDNKENLFEENVIQLTAPANTYLQQAALKKIKEEDQFYRLCEDYQELDIKEVGGIQVMMAYKIFNQIQDLKNIYFNSKLNYREILKELEKPKSNSMVSDSSGAQRKNIQNDIIDQDLLNIFIIQNEICELINEQEINRQEIRCQNLFYIFTFFLSMIEDQDNIYFNYKRNRRKGGNSGYQVISVQIKLLVEDMFKYHRYQNIDKIDSKSSKGRSRTLPEYKQKMEEIRNFQMSYTIKCSIALFKNNLDVHVSQDLVDTIVENLGFEDLDLIHTLILAFAQQENIDLNKKLSIVADRSIELFISMHNFQNDCQNIKESQRLVSSVQKEQKAISDLQKLMKTLECICVINLVYLHHASIDQKIRNSHIVQCLNKKLNEYKECVLKNQIDSQQLYVQIMMETVCKYMFSKKKKSQQQLKKLNLQGVFEEIGNNFSQILSWNEKNLLEQLGFFIQYMEFSDFCITQMQRDKNEFGTEESIEMQKNLNIIRRMTVKNLESFHNVDSLDVSNEKGFNKVLIQVLTKIVQIINTKFNIQKSVLQISFKTINLKLTLINKIICLILENKLKDTASVANLTAIQVLYESSTYYNQILQMLLELNEDIYYILQHRTGSNQQNWDVQHSYSFIVNFLLASENMQGSPLILKFNFLRQNLSWREVKQFLHTLKYIRELASYFQVGILQANIIVFELLLLRFLNYEGQFLQNTTLDFQEKDFTEQSRFSLDQGAGNQNEREIKEESFFKFIELRIEEKLEEYIKVLHQIQKSDESKKLLIYSQANTKIEDIQSWLKEIQQSLKRKRVSCVKLIEKNTSQIKYIIHEINVLRIENNKINSFQPGSQDEQIRKIHYRDIMKEADEIENEIESYDRNSVSSQNKQLLKLDYIVLSLRMHIYCAQYIRNSNQSYFSTQLMEKAFKKLTSICFEKAVGNLSDIYENYSLQSGACQMYHAAAKTQQEINAQQSQIGFIINPFTKIQTLVNNRKYSSSNKILGDLVEYLNIGNGFSYFKNTGSKRIQQLLIQCLKIYCKNQNSLNCFNNLKYYGKLLQITSIRFLVLHEFLRIQTILKDYSDFLRNGVLIDIIGNLLLQKQFNLQILHNLFSKRKSSVINMQLSNFIQSLNEKFLTQDQDLRSTKMYKMSMQYMISLFTSSVRINHKNLESEICEMIFFSRKKFYFLNPQQHKNLQDNSEMSRNGSIEINKKKIKISRNQNQINDSKINQVALGGVCDLFYNILSIDKNSQKQKVYLIVNEDFCSHIISHKNHYSFTLRYLTLIQSLSLLSKITDCRLSMSENSNQSKNPTVLCDEIHGNFISLINFRQLCQLMHNSYLQYDLTYAKQFFYLYHKFDETIKELLREIPSLIQVYQNNTVVKNCSCLPPSQVKTSLFLDGSKQFITESFALDASYMYKRMLVNSQDLQEQQDAILLEQENFEEPDSSMKQSSQSSSMSNNQSEQKLQNQQKLIKQKINIMQDESNQAISSKQLGQFEKLNSQNIIQQAQINFEFKRLRTSMRDFSISKYAKSDLTQILQKSFKCSKIDNFTQRHYQFQQIKLEHDLIILNFIDYNNERAIQISKFNHLNQNYSNFRINSQSQTNLFSDYINDIKRILQNNESDMRNDEKKRKSQVDPNNWWKSRYSNDKQLEKILCQTQTILDYHIFLFFGSEDTEREKKIMEDILEKLKQSEQICIANQTNDKSSLFEQDILIQEKNNLIELLFSLIKCSLFITLNQTKSKLIFELMCIQNIYLQYLGFQSQQLLFQELCKMQSQYQKGYNSSQRTPMMWILSENLLQTPLEFMNCFSENNQTFYRIPSLHYLYENYTPNNSVNFSNNYYLLNPSGDLVHTQSKFQHKFESIRSWEGASGFSVSSKELQKVLKNYQSYTYIGHGAGELYINQKQIQEIKNIKSAILLFGCQSARQAVQLEFNSHQYEITGNSLYFLMNNCKVLIGSLWDITDRDTDRMVLKLIQIIEKATFKKPIDFSQAFLQSREECKLKWLNGSSFVCFGIPTEFYMK